MLRYELKSIQPIIKYSINIIGYPVFNKVEN